MVMIWFLPLLLFISIVFTGFKAKKRQRHQGPPSPPGFPIIGHLHQLGKLPHRSLWRLAQQYGPVMLLKFGRIPTLIISSPDLARHVLKVHDNHCCSRPNLAGSRDFTYNYQDIIFSPFTDNWRDLRRLVVQEVFNVKQVNSSQPIREEEAKNLIDSIAVSATQKAPVNLWDKILASTVSVICRATFGLSFHETVLCIDKLTNLVRDTQIILGSFYASDFIPYVGWIIDLCTGLQGLRERSVRDLDAFIEKMIDMHTQEKKHGSEDFIDLLLKLEKQQVCIGNGKLTRNHIKAILMNVLIAGTDSSAVTITWAMAELARNPRVMKKVQSEIRNKMGNKSVMSIHDLDQLHYLKMVIKETLRLHAPAPLLAPREVMSEFEINGYMVQPKTHLYVNAWAIGRDPNTWRDPEAFLPERFMDRDIDVKGQNFELIPFGSGRRACPGMYMGITTTSFFLANMLYQFDWTLPEGMTAESMDMEEAPGITVTMKNDLQLVPVKFFV